MDDFLSDKHLLESQKLRDLVLAVLDDAKAQDPQVIDLSGRSSFADYMVIASGGSSRQDKAMADRLVQRAKAHDIQPLGIEGADEGEWVLVDLDDVVVHLM